MRYDERGGNGSSRWPLVVGAVLALAVCIVLGFTMFGRPKDAGTQETPQTEAPSDETGTTDVAPDGGEDTSMQPEGGEGNQTDAAQGDPRDAEFAVDPSRTDWNFDASDTKTVYLTFDDGPSANTQRVLDILDEYGIKATFFVTSINPEYAPMIRECYQRGHTIGLHTYSHEYDQVYASVDAYWDDLNRIGEVVREQIGYVPCFIRFPGGSSNTISADYTLGIMTELSQEVVDAGYQYYDWDASCGDGADHTADELVDATIADTSYGYQNIVFLAHDGAGKDTTAEALPRMIEYFQEQGYEFAPIDRSTRVPHHGIGN